MPQPERGDPSVVSLATLRESLLSSAQPSRSLRLTPPQNFFSEFSRETLDLVCRHVDTTGVSSLHSESEVEIFKFFHVDATNHYWRAWFPSSLPTMSVVTLLPPFTSAHGLSPAAAKPPIAAIYHGSLLGYLKRVIVDLSRSQAAHCGWRQHKNFFPSSVLKLWI